MTSEIVPIGVVVPQVGGGLRMEPPVGIEPTTFSLRVRLTALRHGCHQARPAPFVGSTQGIATMRTARGQYGGSARDWRRTNCARIAADLDVARTGLRGGMARGGNDPVALPPASSARLIAPGGRR